MKPALATGRHNAAMTRFVRPAPTADIDESELEVGHRKHAAAGPPPSR